jgi:hypothetical protein
MMQWSMKEYLLPYTESDRKWWNENCANDSDLEKMLIQSTMGCSDKNELFPFFPCGFKILSHGSS